MVGDDDGVVVVPSTIAESVLVEAEEKAATESEIRAAVRDGMPPLEAYERYGTSDVSGLSDQAIEPLEERESIEQRVAQSLAR